MYCSNKYYSENPNILATLNKDTCSFIRFINILQAKELNKGQIKYHTFYMRQTFKYKVSVSWGYPRSLDLKQTTFLLDCHLVTNLVVEKKKHMTD